MSDIKMIDSKRLYGRVEKLQIMTHDVNSSDNKFEAFVTITHDDIWTDCILCGIQTYTKHRYMDEGICEICRKKMIDRLKLIINFQ